MGAALGSGQDWTNTEAYPKVDLSGLSPAQKASVLKLIRQHGCPCGCNMKVAECRLKDPNCYYSRGLATVIVMSIRAGKSESAALADAEASPYAHVPEHKILDRAVEIPVAGAPVTGPKDAPITLPITRSSS